MDDPKDACFVGLREVVSEYLLKRSKFLTCFISGGDQPRVRSSDILKSRGSNASFSTTGAAQPRPVTSPERSLLDNQHSTSIDTFSYSSSTQRLDLGSPLTETVDLSSPVTSQHVPPPKEPPRNIFDDL